ncbi:MAG: pyridoxal phosphate-dependent aminotransferase family protein [Lewinellaceae bacterium]|nr:pyridoxal phosphate-dependent aminotransferase family protein [Lewinellaceae bacterium]
MATIPIIVDEKDAVVLDMQVHNSVQMAVQQLKAQGVSITMIRHNDMDALEAKIVQLRNKHRKVWYFADGVYSMYGDFAPMQRLKELMDQYEPFHLYIDDAHGVSWAGENGIGVVCSQLFYHEKKWCW